MKIQKNIDLKDYNSFALNSKAKYFTEVSNVEELKEALKWAREKNLPIFILGRGTNILLPRAINDSLVIKINNGGISITKDRFLEVGAGVLLAELINFSIQHSLEGLEFLSGIPGTIGGAVVGNAGSFGGEVKDLLDRVEVFSTANPDKKIILTNKDCLFEYRNSIFKKHKEFVVWKVFLKVKEGKREDIKRNVEKFLKNKLLRQPLSEKSAGSFFKNVPIENFSKEWKDFFLRKNLVKNGLVPAGFLIDHLGLKGKKIGGAAISLKHANFLINMGKANREDFLKLRDFIKRKVFEKFNVKLEEEVIIL